jgi:4-aminobutyrate aminotransferase-like enzyme
LETAEVTSPRLVVMEGSYGTGYGPLAHTAVCERFIPVACGSKPVVVQMDSKTIEKQIGKAKGNKCIAFLVEMIRSRDGRPLTSDQWRATVDACEKHNVMLIVDEAVTAIRCGAPFAHQLPEYRFHGQPDLVLFGKAIRAVVWNGINVGKLQITGPDERLQMVLEWQLRFTETAPPHSLLQSWGTIVAAQSQDWPESAVHIGRTLREVLLDLGIDSSGVRHLRSSCIYLDPPRESRAL